MLEFNQYHKTSTNIYVDIECLIKKVDGCKNNPIKLSTTKVGVHIPSGYSICAI